ncbi:uncharacterized protein MELLADRAFT_115273 [Melampsora larici-populina 98AG31]|uniref:Nuclear condensin complex subunit 3 C-terminal domain-containing protein n=1 Tax=Melampsora larici-populina (strain 98AG31 / pathotype 3-4-7) TaxID=747676 RepID=F4R8F9_MELLP|nr:uncharacterized protein MELLADRAFT_115273 [Melampsora larici-populina 98AG31]EGG11613.1 hypothetical protein MELLADRAFT_115273 [Melampsora larici-populina 98AG31]
MARAPSTKKTSSRSKKPATATSIPEDAPVDEVKTTNKKNDTLNTISNSILAIFNQSQNSLTGHRKLVNNLHRIFISASAIFEETDADEMKDTEKTIKLTGEKTFTEAIYTVLDNLVSTKKGIVEVDRVIKFIGAFCSFATDHDPLKDSSDQTPTNRLLLHIIKYLNRGFEAKNKIVRFRCCQLLAYVVNSLEDIDNDLFSELKSKLLVRSHDKEKDVRQQAAIALMNFRPVGEEEDEDEDEVNVNDALIDLMIRDPSSEVRRTVLHKLCEVPNSITLPAVLTRLRDVDTLIRRTVYRDLFLAVNAKPEPTLSPDPSQCFTLDERHLILKGLKDREEAVRKEATSLVNCWIRSGFGGNIEKFLQTMDLVGLISEEEESEGELVKTENIERAVKAWISAGGLEDSLEVEDLTGEATPVELWSESWWADINPERAFLLRVVTNHLKSIQDEARLDQVMPVVTALAFRIEHNFTALSEALELISKTSSTDMADEETQEIVRKGEAKTFVLKELLSVAMLADYGDETGRRKMFSLLRDLIVDQLLPLPLIAGCLEILLKLSTGERDFMRVIVESVQELRGNLEADPACASDANGRPAASGGGDGDDDDDDEDDDEGHGEASFRKGKDGGIRVATFSLNPVNASLDLRSLAIVKALLERVSGSIKDNTSMFGIVHELIVPAVRCKEGPIREGGLLDRQIALDSFGVFIHQVQAAEVELRTKVLKIVFDLLLQHGIGFLAEKGHGPDRVVEFLLYSLDQESKEVQATAVVGISKLMLSGIITNSEVLQMLVLVYFSPETCDNQKLRQCLSYFLPVYCYCSSANQRRMQSMMLPALDVLGGVYDDQEDKSEMLSPAQISVQLVDWTDPSKVVVLPGCEVDWEVHLDAAIEVIKTLFTSTQKELKERRPLSDSVSKNVVAKFQTGLQKKFPDRLNPLEEEALREIAGLETFFNYIQEFIDNLKEEGSDDEPESGLEQGADSDDYQAKVPSKRKSKTPIKKSTKSAKSLAMRKQSLTDDEDEDDPAPRRSVRPRASRADPKVAAINEELSSLIGSSTDEDDSEDEGEETEKENEKHSDQEDDGNQTA